MRSARPIMQFGPPGPTIANPYKTLGVSREASSSDIKKAFREKATSTHPDRNPDLDPEEAQRRFQAVGEAYEILKDKDKRREYDQTGTVGGGGGMPSQAAQEAMFREFMKQNGFGGMGDLGGMGGFGGFGGPPPPKPWPQPEMECRIRADVASIERASRASGISTDKDDIRARFAGTQGLVVLVDPRDKTVKVRVMVSAGRAAEVWYPSGALWDPRKMKEGAVVQICPDADKIFATSREAGIDIDLEKDEARAACAGKTGRVLAVDQSDQTAKVRVVDREAGAATILWFAIAGLAPAAAP